jgi:peptidoglycan/LPS O-acetylase OafA/YrhL
MREVPPVECETPLAPSAVSPVGEPDPAHRAFLSRSYFPLLDGLRCLSIVAVVWFHAAGATATSGIFSRGEEGVSLFFVISGFLITTILLREQSTTGGISLKRFYLRRTLRIFPLYYALLALYAILVAVIESHSAAGDQFWRNLPYFLTYTSNWFVTLGADRVIFFFAWSLATEEQFYFFWPWVVKASARPSPPIVAMLGFLALHCGGAFAAASGALDPTSLFSRILVNLSPLSALVPLLRC